VNATGNAFLIDAVNRTLALPLVSSRVARWFTPVRVSQYHHVVIVEAIAKRQAERAKAMMTEHVYIGSERIRCSFAAIGRGEACVPLACDLTESDRPIQVRQAQDILIQPGRRVILITREELAAP
jgi:hypothetical protein